MSGLAKGLIGLVAVLHVAFLIVEMFLWTTPSVRRRFGLTEDFARQSKPLAANMGLYNGFLAAGLFWSLWPPNPYAVPIAIFFLLCVVIAGIVGAATVKMRILYIQALPAVLALLAIKLT